MILLRSLSATAILALCAVNGAVIAESPSASLEYQRDVFPIIRSHCVNCHGPDTQESEIRLDDLSIDLVNNRAAAETWHEVLNALSAGEMPPADERPLSTEQFEVLTTFVRGKVDDAIRARQKTDGRIVLRRLNRIEYHNTMRDLLGMEMDYARDLPPDAVSSEGFTNNGRFLRMSAFQLEYYLDTARRAMDRVIVDGPAPKSFDYTFEASNLKQWLGNAEKSNHLGRQQEFLATMKEEYPEEGDFLVRVKLTAELKPEAGFPLLEVSVGYRPDTQILLREFDLVEIVSNSEQVFEFRGRLEEFPLPVRGQGKYPGLVVRVRNVYDDGSPLPKIEKDDKKQNVYAEEDHLPKLNIRSVEFHGPVFDRWPPDSHRRILFESPLRNENEGEYVEEVLHRFMARAFRRPIERFEIDRMIEHFNAIRSEFPTFEETIRETLALALIQPSFLYLIEPAGEEKRPINDWELASRLSYFLWSTMPDDRLTELARKGKLKKPRVLRRQVERMLEDPNSFRFVRQFTDQWLQLGRLDSIAVDKKRHRDFDDELKDLFRSETQHFFGEVLQSNLSALNLLDSPFILVNERLARHYGIDGVFGNEMRRVPVPEESGRGGLFGQASILMSNSTGGDSHPIRRAVWIRDRLLKDPPAPPPPDVPSLEQADPKFHELSIRDQLEAHRKKQSCEKCHRNIDPWGIALENFDAVGSWREIDASDVLPGGIELSGVDGLKRHLIDRHVDKFSESLVSRLLTYALGRRLELSDHPSVDDLVEEFRTNDYRLRDLVISLVGSESFQTK